MSIDPLTPFQQLPPSLLEVLSNSIVLDLTLPYLPLASTFALFRTSRGLRDLLLTTPSAFRYLDLSRCRGAYVAPIARIDSGGHSWRAERMDENLTEDEFFAGPLRGVLGKLRRIKMLQNVQTLVLDDLASVTVDLIHDIVTSSEYNVRFLSIRRCRNVNQSKLQQLLCHICRPSRPEGTPKLQGLYVFHALTSVNHSDYMQDYSYNFDTMGVMDVPGAQLGGQVSTSGKVGGGESARWYSRTGQAISVGHSDRSPWEETLQTCQGIISFDAVLCSHMHADMAYFLHPASADDLRDNKPGIAPLATVALGPAGCNSCGRAPHGAPTWGKSDLRDFPLVWPPPRSGKLIDAVRPPPRIDANGKASPQRLIVSCKWCLANRHCTGCNTWWCPDCYNPNGSRRLAVSQRREAIPLQLLGSTVLEEYTKAEVSSGDRIKVFHGLCTEHCLVDEWMAGAGGGGMWG